MTSTPKFLSSLLLAGFFYLNASSQYKPADLIPSDPNVKIGKLDNGLTYYIAKNATPEKKVELRLAVNAGSVLENEDQRGLAHFMEHMSFNGTKHFPKNELVDFLQKSGIQFGADLNAYTGFDETVYILPVPTDDPKMLEQGLLVLEDWAFNNLFDKTEIEKERGVVLEEARLGKGSGERMSALYFPRLFNGSKYATRLPIGKEAVLKNFKPETLKTFYKTWYRPNQMAVMVVGDINPAAVEKLVKAHFGKFTNPRGAPVRPSITPILARVKPDAMVLTDEEATNTFIQIFNFVKPARPVKTWGDYRNAVMEGLVSALINQRLQELTQKENPPFLFASTGFSQFLRGYNSFNSFAVLSKGTVQDAINALIEATNRARQFGFLKTEVDRAKASLLTSTQQAYNEREKSPSGQRVGEYVSSFLNGSPVPGITHRYNFIKQSLAGISLQEINAIAKNMPSTANAFTLVQAPAALKSQLPDSSQVLQALVTANNIAVQPYEEKTVASTLLDKEPVAGKVTSQTVNEKLGTTNFSLSNGVTVTIKPTKFKNDDIQLDAWRLGGAHKYSLDDKGNAENAAQLALTMGVKDLTPTELDKFMAGKNFNVSPYINADEEGIEGSSSVKDFETFLQLIYLYFTEPRKDVALFNAYISKQKSAIEFLSKNPNASYQDTLNKIIYNNNPWKTAFPRAADYDKINLNRSMAIYKEIYGNAYGFHFTFVGNIDPATATPLLEKYLGALPAAAKENTNKDIGARMINGYTDIVIKRGKEQQAVINLIFEGETTYTRENQQQLSVLLEALNIEIIEKLREEMSGMYGGGISGAVVKRPYEHYTIRANIPCGPENVDKLTEALLGIIKTAQETGVSQNDLDKVKQTIKKQYSVNMQQNETWLQSLSGAFINGEDPENILNYLQMIDSITVEDLKNVAKKYLTVNNMVKSVMYPESASVKEEVKTIKKGF
ncbi:MAG: insulinase family protein [Chitinophagaceae bacterium]